jgi:hypothetical protein
VNPVVSPASATAGRSLARPAAASLAAALLGFASLAGPAHSQGFTKADSGWVPLFNGTDFTGLYSRMYDKEATDQIDPVFKVQDGTIKVAVGGGHIGTKKKFSHYRMRVEYRFDQDNTSHNAGLMYHVDESVARMSNKWSRSIECQMKQNETGSAFSIQQVTFTTKVVSKTNFANYSPTGVEVQVCASGCDGRNYKGNPLIPGGAHWNRMEVVVRGSDSAAHLINDTTVFRLWNIRIFNAGDTPNGPYGTGGLALQAEGAALAYRNWEIMELPADGPDRLQRLFLTSLTGGAKVNAGGKADITWKTLGAVPKVSVFFHTGDGKWEMAADNIANTGSFPWTVPNTPTQALRVKVSAAPWVRADSSASGNQIIGGTPVLRSGPLRAVKEPARTIRDPAGRALRAREPGRRIPVPAFRAE